jgi:hypothetical protein
LPPDRPATAAEEELLNGIARRARLGDRDARELLWRAFAPRLEPVVWRCGRMTWQAHWARRDGRPWALDDLRQEAWRVFAELTEAWSGEGSFVPYATAYFPWRLRGAMRRLGPPRFQATARRRAEPIAECGDLRAVETEPLMRQIAAALSPFDAAVLHLRLREDAGIDEIARRLDRSRRSVNRSWARIRRVAREVLAEG